MNRILIKRVLLGCAAAATMATAAPLAAYADPPNQTQVAKDAMHRAQSDESKARGHAKSAISKSAELRKRRIAAAAAARKRRLAAYAKRHEHSISASAHSRETHVSNQASAEKKALDAGRH
ncbi:MAG TPA: hypothetical protein VGG29_18405 [Caulobacteraceae bacterium]|jgi:hypothetical protein